MWRKRVSGRGRKHALQVHEKKQKMIGVPTDKPAVAPSLTQGGLNFASLSKVFNVVAEEGLEPPTRGL